MHHLWTFCSHRHTPVEVSNPESMATTDKLWSRIRHWWYKITPKIISKMRPTCSKFYKINPRLDTLMQGTFPPEIISPHVGKVAVTSQSCPVLTTQKTRSMYKFEGWIWLLIPLTHKRSKDKRSKLKEVHVSSSDWLRLVSGIHSIWLRHYNQKSLMVHSVTDTDVDNVTMGINAECSWFQPSWF